MRHNVVISIAILAVLWALPAGADWSTDPDENNPVCTVVANQTDQQMISDGMGGAIIAWVDYRDERADIYAQRIDDQGELLWGSGGVPVCVADENQLNVQLAADGIGGAILVWEDYRDSDYPDIYAQRVARDATVVWATDGVPISREEGNQMGPQLASDGAGGAIMSWHDSRSGTDSDIFAQRVDSSGVRQWASGGVLVCVDGSDQFNAQLVGDGAGGAIFCWLDERAGVSDYGVYCQRVNSGGEMQWAAGGVAACTASGHRFDPRMATDGSGGAFVVWEDHRDAGWSDIYIQRVESDGSMGMIADGAAVCTATLYQMDARVGCDGDGDAIVVWHDQRAGTGESDIYAQRVLANGAALWTTDGVAVCATDESVGRFPDLTVNDSGEAVFAWHDMRGADIDIYAQCLDANGDPKWTENGVVVCTAGGSQAWPVIASGSSGDFIIAWQDHRAGSGYDIYAQLIERNGYPGDPGPAITEVIDNPDDQGGLVVLSWTPSYLDAYPRQLVAHYSVWRRVPPARSGEADPERSGWAHVEDIPAYYWDEYGSVAPTFGIYPGSGSPEETEYKVVAHTADQWIYWESVVRSGYSVDNLAPGAPLDLTGTPTGTDVLLAWTASGSHDEDLACYRVYRGDSPGFVPDGSTLIGTATGTAFTDPAPGGGTWYYLVTGEDAHGNEGLPSNEAPADTGSSSTLAAAFDCQPASGVVPFTTQMTVTLDNLYSGQIRRFSAHVDAVLAGGASYPNWRAGYTNVAAGGSFVTSWNQNIPALGALIGANVFSLAARDVTPAPYNQPPYPPSGDTAVGSCTVTGVAP